MPKSRPILITIFAILMVLAGLAIVAISLLAFLGGVSGNVAIVNAFLLVLGLIYFILGWGVIKGWGWVWWGIVIVNIINIITVAYNVFVQNPPDGIGTAIMTFLGGSLIPIIILLYMNSRKVKEWFGIGKTSAST